MTPARHPHARYRVVVTELIDGQPWVVMDATGAGFHAAVANLRRDRLVGEHGAAGDPHLLEHIAELIAAHPTGTHQPPR